MTAKGVRIPDWIAGPPPKGRQIDARPGCLVTGTSSGIGLAIADVLGETGQGLTVAARRPEKLAGAVEQQRGKGYEVEEVAANLTSEEDVQRVVAAHRERFGRLHVLVNSAGVGFGAAVADMQTKRVDMQLDLNLRAIVLFYRECAELLRAAGAEHRNALVVNLSSISGKAGSPGCRSTPPPRRR